MPMQVYVHIPHWFGGIYCVPVIIVQLVCCVCRFCLVSGGTSKHGPMELCGTKVAQSAWPSSEHITGYVPNFNLYYVHQLIEIIILMCLVQFTVYNMLHEGGIAVAIVYSSVAEHWWS